MNEIQSCVLALPEIAAWPQLAALFEGAASTPRPDWEWPLIACRAVGGDPSAAVPGAAAAACMYISIMLVDDMLDEDPRGEYRRSGAGPAANMALAFQAAAFRAIEGAPVSAERRAAVSASLARLGLATALGQHLDAQRPQAEAGPAAQAPPGGRTAAEARYWQVVQAKSTPYYSAALHVGALLGGASPELAAQIGELGSLLGEIIQIHDDLLDAFETPATPDWTRGQPNLPILYARTADHPGRERFLALLPHAAEPQVLRQVQQMLIDSGAVSYCAYHLFRRHRRARHMLEGIPLADPAPLAKLVAQQTQPLIQLFESSGIEVPPELQEWAS